MSGYPPPPPPPSGSWPPPPAGGQYPPPYNRNDWKQQRRAMKAQVRMQRAQMRMQMRANRRGSIVGPIVLLALGVMFLLAQMGRLSWNHVLGWYGSWWPLVMIVAGVVLLGEWFYDQNRHDANGNVRGPRSMGSGVVFLLIFLAFVGVMSRISTRWYDHGVRFEDNVFGHGFGGFDRLGDKHDSEDSVSSAISAGTPLIVRNPRGDVMITGSSSDGQVHVSVHKQAWAWETSDAESKENRLQPKFSNDGNSLVLNVEQVEGGQADLTIELPSTTPLTLQCDHGDVSVNSVRAALMLSANHGNVDLNSINGNVNLHVNYDNSSITGHNINGNVQVEGRAGSIEMTDVAGGVTLHGDFFDTTHLERVNGLVRFQTNRTQFEAAKLNGTFEVETGPDLQADGLVGPVVLTTHSRNITLERVLGSVQVVNRNGTVRVTSASPLAPIQIKNEKGSVDVGVPGNAGFVLSATTRHGSMENDFGLTSEGDDDRPSLHGTIGSGGSTVTITTTDGDVTVRKAVVTPLPPPPPVPPMAPAKMGAIAPVTPARPAVKAPKMPPVPKTPAPPKSPTGSVDF